MPEFFLIFSIISLLSIFVFYSQNLVTAGKLLSIQMSFLVFFILSLTSILYLNISSITITLLNGVGDRNALAYLFGFLLLAGSFFLISFMLTYFSKNSLQEYELIILVMLILLGGLCIVFSNNLLGLYLGVELQSLGLYILATMKVNSTFATEAGLKYFVLGAFASSLLVFGISLFYGALGMYNYNDIAALDSLEQNSLRNYVTLSLLFIFISLLFKVGSAPFHMWVPDVYEGVPIIITAFFSAIPKLSIFSLFVRFVYDIYACYMFDLSILFVCCGLLSVLIGSFGAVGQENLKRVISYSAIAHTGFIVFGLSLGSFESCVAVVFYLVIYLSLTLNLFGSTLGLQQKETGSVLKIIANLSYAYKSHPWVCLSLGFSLFSIAGVPPLSGFFSKLLIFGAAIKANFILMSIIIILVSVVSSAYYLRIIRSLFFVINRQGWLLFDEIVGTHAYSVSTLFLFNILFMYFGTALYYYIVNSLSLFFL